MISTIFVSYFWRPFVLYESGGVIRSGPSTSNRHTRGQSVVQIQPPLGQGHGHARLGACDPKFGQVQGSNLWVGEMHAARLYGTRGVWKVCQAHAGNLSCDRSIQRSLSGRCCSNKKNRERTLKLLGEFAASLGFRIIDQIDLEALNSSRSVRAVSVRTWTKELGTLRHFFRYCSLFSRMTWPRSSLPATW